MSVELPLPETYTASLSLSPVSNSNVGVPDEVSTVTFSENKISRSTTSEFVGLASLSV